MKVVRLNVESSIAISRGGNPPCRSPSTPSSRTPWTAATVRSGRFFFFSPQVPARCAPPRVGSPARRRLVSSRVVPPPPPTGPELQLLHHLTKLRSQPPTILSRSLFFTRSLLPPFPSHHLPIPKSAKRPRNDDDNDG
ncbi:hypothetical protein BRADI_4g08942v3 [Brachypodium distachyon]|uniref:Uncharacterized protein n=1 Tax=Brachypodium distachyon TaxID=15368 RepID=A0A2K2CLF2_BRADI|nr:hypothetical protein BRADI_4g08942v3 [Brachypodium distachyon]